VHSFVTNHQSDSFTEDITQLLEGEAVCVIDFQMNLGHCYADTVQAEHWAKTQTTIFPCIFYINVGDEIQCHSFMVMSDDLEHDNAFVESSMARVLKLIREDVQYTVTQID